MSTASNADPLSWRTTLVAGFLTMWLGGLGFYAGVVVEVGAEVLGSHVEFGFITRKVAVWLNLVASAVLLVLLADLVFAQGPGRRRGQWILWTVMAASQLTLWFLHPWLDALLDENAGRILDGEAFYTRHRIYLLVSTLQWVTGAVYFRRLLVAG